jgi:uncharacterized repeat protein (TIGR01451 family)
MRHWFLTLYRGRESFSGVAGFFLHGGTVMNFRYRPAMGRLISFIRPSRGAGRHRRRGIRAVVPAVVLAGTALAAATLGAVTPAGRALAVPSGDEYPATWSVVGNVATGTTLSGVTVTATVTGPATLDPPGSLVFTGSTPAFFPATTTQALHVSASGCDTACGSITYDFSRPVLTPMLDIGDIGAGAVDAGSFTAFHDTPVTLTSGTFTLDSAGSQTPNMSIQNGGVTAGFTNPAGQVNGPAGGESSCGTFGCGSYDIATATPEITSLTMNFGYAGTGMSSNLFSLLLGVTPAAPALTMTQTVSPATAYTAGTQVTFRYLVTNTGNVPLTGVHPTVTAFTGTGTASVISCPSATLAAGDAETCTQTYRLTAADVTAGLITNTATATGDPAGLEPVTTEPSSATVEIPAHPAISIKQTASPGTATTAGTTVHLRFVVKNTGNRPLTGVTVHDGLPGLSAISCPSGTLAVGQAETCTASYQVTAADVAAGRILSTATATGTGPTDAPVASGPSTATVTLSLREAWLPVTG